MTIEAGQAIPSVNIKLVSADGVADATSDAVLGTGTVVFFSVPGAFTPTCHVNHLPGYVALADELYAAGANRIVCATVNDHHVVKAWAETSGALGQMEFIADGLGHLANVLGLERDMTQGGLGVRFRRAAMIVKDGVVRQVNVEQVPGEVTSSGAPAMLEALAAL